VTRPASQLREMSSPRAFLRTGEAARVVGADNVSGEQRWMASEDMSRFLREVPGCFFFLGGARTPEEKPHHNPRFDFDESVLAQGVAIMCETVAGLCA